MSENLVRMMLTRNNSMQVADLLQDVFSSELICPSECIWIVSPWISDINIIDNRTNSFSSMEPSWSNSQVRFSSVLSKLIGMETKIHIATRSESHNGDFLQRLEQLVGSHNPLLKIHISDKLHAKGILGDEYYIHGSMNFTFMGITINEEAVNFCTDPEIIAGEKLEFKKRWK